MSGRATNSAALDNMLRTVAGGVIGVVAFDVGQSVDKKSTVNLIINDI